VRDIKNMTQVPIAIYHVSGEYAMLWHAAAAGAFGLAEGVTEALMGAKRAGATILITYFTPFLLKHIKEQGEKQRAADEAASKGQ
jgi:porphobilinogen synthase